MEEKKIKTATKEDTKTFKAFRERVIALQNELKAPKSKFNSFGNYRYRSCEDILEAVKPLLAKYNMTLNLSDYVEEIGGRFYVKAVASLSDTILKVYEDGTEAADQMASIGWAREDESKKGMDGSQITGTASSYARKYALNGLLLIDDTKDADTDEFAQQNGARRGKTSELDKAAYEREIDEQPTLTALVAWWRKNVNTIPDDIKESLQQRCHQRSAMFNQKTQEG